MMVDRSTQPDSLILDDLTSVDHSVQRRGAERCDYWHGHVPKLGQEYNYLGNDADDQCGQGEETAIRGRRVRIGPDLRTPGRTGTETCSPTVFSFLEQVTLISDLSLLIS
jgi:hypothetical protein